MPKLKNLPSLTAKSFLLTFFLIVQGCDDDNEPKDTTAPVIAFTNLDVDSNVWNTVPIALEATDDTGISLIEVFVDGDLVASLTEAPFETSWDSNLVTDGTHTIKAVVTDKSGNRTEQEVSVVVRNVLVTIDIGADQLYVDETFAVRGFVFLSDENGNVIASQEYFNGDHIVLKNPGFNGEKFILTELLVEAVGVEEWVRLWTFPDIERGKNWVLLHQISDDVTSAGQANLTLQNAAPFTNYTITSDFGPTYAGENATQASVSLLNSPGKLYILAETMAEQGNSFTYGLISNIIVGSNTVDLSMVNQPLTTITADVPVEATYLGINLTGFPVANDYSAGLHLGFTSATTGGGSLDIRYPGTAFPSYFSSIELVTPEMYYLRGSNSEVFEIRHLANEVSMTFGNSTLSYSASGDFDFLTTRFENANQTTEWNLILPETNDGALPSLAIPDELQTFDLPVLGQPEYYVIYDFDELSSYEDLKAFVRTSTRGTNELFDDGVNYIEVEHTLPLSGGRLKPVTGKHSLRTFSKK